MQHLTNKSLAFVIVDVSVLNTTRFVEDYPLELLNDLYNSTLLLTEGLPQSYCP
jgi:hypothetical protein